MPQPTRHRRVRALLIGALFVAVLSATHPLWLQAVGETLALREQPVQADGVVVIAGNSRARSLKGVELVRAGYALTLYVTEDIACVPLHCVKWSELWRRGEITALDGLLPREAVVPLLTDRETPAVGTDHEAELAWAEIRPRGVRRLILVTDEWHSRRAAMAWRKAVDGEALIVSVPSVHERVPLAGWWRNREALKAIPMEFAKFVAYAVTRSI